MSGGGGGGVTYSSTGGIGNTGWTGSETTGGGGGGGGGYSFKYKEYIHEWTITMDIKVCSSVGQDQAKICLCVCAWVHV